MERTLFVSDDEGNWFIRRVAVVELDVTRNEKVYRCDEHLGGPYMTLEAAVADYHANGLMLSLHDRTCSCPGAQWARHQQECRKEEDDVPLLGCNCDDCLAELFECPEDCEECSDDEEIH